MARQALNDLRSGDVLYGAGQYENAAFLCQQAAEKSAKAFLAWHDVRFPKTHSLEELRKLIEPMDAEMAQVVDRARGLTDYAWEFRYPGSSLIASEALVRDALVLARSVYDAVLSRLPIDARPS